MACQSWNYESNVSGAVQAQYRYDPYGIKTDVVTESVASDFQFAGMLQHSRSDLSLTLFREYDRSLGRWLSRDPTSEIEGLVQTNLFHYVDGDPTNLIDPPGLGAIQAHVSGWVKIPGTPLPIAVGHDIVVLVNETTGVVTLTEYGRFNPADTSKGIVRIQNLGKVQIGADGVPTTESFKAIYQWLTDHRSYAKRPAGGRYFKDVDYDKALKRARDLEKEGPTPYGWFGSGRDCSNFGNDVINAGRRQ